MNKISRKGAKTRSIIPLRLCAFARLPFVAVRKNQPINGPSKKNIY